MGFLRQSDEHQADGSCTQDEDPFAGLEVQVMHALYYTAQRLGQGGVGKFSAGPQFDEVGLDQSGGNHNRFGIRSVEEQKVVAQLFLPSNAGWT